MSQLDTALQQILAQPLDPAAHDALGDAWREAAQPITAAACYRTAVCLGDPDLLRLFKLALAEIQAGRIAPARARLGALPDGLPDEVTLQVTKALELCETLPEVPLESFDHTRHLQMTTLAAALRGLGLPETLDLLDVGGGDGLLCHHLPAARYRLADPGTNGLRGMALPFAEQSVDAVVACRVLERIPAAARFEFLDGLRRISRGHLLLLGAFAADGDRSAERLQLMAELTDAAWAEEVLEYGLPELAAVQAYAEDRGLAIQVEPHGSAPASFLGAMVDHYARRLGKGEELARINEHLNALDPRLLTNEALPGSYLVHCSW